MAELSPLRRRMIEDWKTDLARSRPIVTTVDMATPLWLETPHSQFGTGVVHAIKWQTQNRYMQVEAMAELTTNPETTPAVTFSPKAA
ncbi:hypothetical protein UCD39_26070 [Nitrospirillum sp. BR 11752]|uniref:hypothetical protein n=1 Tax=Nitrospirillum sp. BR 11752 TaxID=3104293 RepID=UPI002EBB31FA|nr:hypothetical protein [Nitrospirillum sp. BR 11752]